MACTTFTDAVLTTTSPPPYVVSGTVAFQKEFITVKRSWLSPTQSARTNHERGCFERHNFDHILLYVWNTGISKLSAVCGTP